MVYGVWCMVYGVWCMVCGVWCMVYGVASVGKLWENCGHLHKLFAIAPNQLYFV